MIQRATQPPRRALATAIAIGICALAASCSEKTPNKPVPNAGPTAGKGAESAPSPIPDPATDMRAIVGLTWDAPDGWISVREYKASRIDTWDITGADDSVSAFASWFGPDRGGGIQWNLNRWAAQIKLDDGRSPAPELATFDANGFHTTIATYTGQRIIGMESESQAPPTADAARLVGAVVEGGPEGAIFFKLSGPTPIIEELTPAFLQLVRSVRPIEAPQPDGAATP